MHGCYARADGRLRVIDRDKGQSCKNRERVLSWNHEGVPGGGEGAHVIERIRMDVVIPPGEIEFDLEPSWIQRAGTINEFFGTISFTFPETCEGAETPGWVQGGVGMQVGERGDGFGETDWSTGGFSGNLGEESPLWQLNNGGVGGPKPLYLFEPLVDTTRTIHASAGGECQGEGEDIIAHIAIDVVEIS